MFDSKIETYSKETLNKIKLDELHQFVFPESYEQILSWSEKRQMEFLLARKAIKEICLQHKIELNIGDLYQKEDRQCVWPQGIIGSISHARNSLTNELSIYVALSDEHTGLGVDIEYLSRFKNTNISSHVLTDNERKLIENTNIESPIEELTKLEFFTGVIFSAKESLFKAVYPSYGKYFGFQDAEVIDFARGINKCLEKLIQIKLHIHKNSNYNSLIRIKNKRVLTLTTKEV